MGTDCAQREETILKLSETLISELHTLRTTLEATFARRTGEEKEGSGIKEQPSNVLDEICENLLNARGRIRELQDFIAGAVINKLI